MSIFVGYLISRPLRYLSRISPNGRVRHKAFLRWVLVQSRSPCAPSILKNASGTVGIPLKRSASGASDQPRSVWTLEIVPWGLRNKSVDRITWMLTTLPTWYPRQAASNDYCIQRHDTSHQIRLPAEKYPIYWIGIVVICYLLLAITIDEQ